MQTPPLGQEGREQGSEASCFPGSSFPWPGRVRSSCQLNPIVIWDLYHSRSSAASYPLGSQGCSPGKGQRREEDGMGRSRDPLSRGLSRCRLRPSLPQQPLLSGASSPSCALLSRVPAPVGASLSQPGTTQGAQPAGGSVALEPGTGQGSRWQAIPASYCVPNACYRRRRRTLGKGALQCLRSHTGTGPEGQRHWVKTNSRASRPAPPSKWGCWAAPIPRASSLRA